MLNIIIPQDFGMIQYNDGMEYGQKKKIDCRRDNQSL